MSDVATILDSKGGDINSLDDETVDLHFRHIHHCVHNAERKNGNYISPSY